MRTKFLFIFLLFVLLLAACQSTEPLPTETAVAVQPSDTPVVVAEASPTSEATAVLMKEYTPIFEAADCPMQLPGGQIEGETVECGYLVIPENRYNPESRDIRLAVAIFHPADGTIEPDPVIYLAGGPGGSALELLYLSFEGVFVRALETGRDMILFDQRGVGLSEPALDCPELLDLSLDLMDREVDGQELTEDEAYDLTLDTLLACRDELSADADLSAYNTLANAADVEDLRLALGYDQVNLWGGSYGTRLALEVMRDYPAGLRSVVLDSVYPPDVNLNLEMPKNYRRALTVLFDACAADEGCNQAYPDLENVFFETVEQLNADPAPVVFTHPSTNQKYDALITGDFLMAFMFRYLYFSDVLPILPQMIYSAREGDFLMLSQIYSSLLFQAELMSHGMQFSVQCNEETSFITPEEYQEMLGDYPKVAELFDDSLFGKMGFELCAQWGAGEATAIENEAVVSDVPTLVMAGEFDPITPPNWARQTAERISNGFFFEFPGTGHGASAKTLGGSDCGPQIMFDFIDDPTTEPDSSCIAEMGIHFALPVNFSEVILVPVEVPEYGIRTLVPEGWNESAPDYFVAPDLTIELVFTDVRGQDRQAFLESWEASESIAEIESNGILWTVQEVHRADGYVATSPHEDGFYMVLIVTTPEQKELLYEPIFLPIVNAFQIDETLLEESSAVEEPEENGTPPETGVNLVPFESETFGISGLVPEGWSEVQPGVYARGNSASDQTLMIQKSYPELTTDELVAALLPGLGVTELPEASGTIETDFAVWTLYQVSVTAPGVGTFTVDLAFTEVDAVPHLVILQAEAEEHAAVEMQANIFIPAVEAVNSLD